jgi:hypothetical protein
MASLAAWIAFGAGNLFLLWQLSLDEPDISRLITGFLLIVLNLVLGIRVGDMAARSYVKAASQLNRHLADQNNDLRERNVDLLSELSSERPSDQLADFQGRATEGGHSRSDRASAP